MATYPRGKVGGRRWEGLDIFSLRGGLSARAGVVGRPDNNDIVLRCLKAALSVRGQRYHHLKGYI